MKTQPLHNPEYNNGDTFLYPCQHKKPDGTMCGRNLKMRVVYSSTMQCYVFNKNYVKSFDMRNQLWYCYQHR